MNDLVLITGGAGFIGSHMCAALAEAGIRFLVLDDFRNSRRDVIERLSRLCGCPVTYIEADVGDAVALARIFARHPITAVAHFAGSKSVAESVRDPLAYHRNNVVATLTLLDAMVAANVKQLVFSSSATVYGAEAALPYTEQSLLRPANPYGGTKLAVEAMLADLCAADPEWRAAALRYFNPVGAHASGLIGEDPNGVPNNLMPYIARVACGALPRLQVFGGDYPTLDGTGARDYVHVMDLVEGHVAALQYLRGNAGLHTFNLGSGSCTTVLEMVSAFERASGRTVPYDIVARRAGDLGSYWADAALAKKTLGWQTTRGVDVMCADTWRWQQFWAAGGCADGTNSVTLAA